MTDKRKILTPKMPKMLELLKSAERGKVIQPGPTRSALMRRGLVHGMTAAPELRGTLTTEGYLMKLSLK